MWPEQLSRGPAGKKPAKSKSELSAEQMQELREAFNLFDTDNAGASVGWLISLLWPAPIGLMPLFSARRHWRQGAQGGHEGTRVRGQQGRNQENVFHH